METDCTGEILACEEMERTIVPIGIGGRGHGFRSLRFAASESGVRARYTGASITEASERLMVLIDLVRTLIDRGMLRKMSNTVRYGGIDPKSLDEVAATYISSALLAPALGCPVRSVASRLRKLGAGMPDLGWDAVGLVRRRGVVASRRS